MTERPCQLVVNRDHFPMFHRMPADVQAALRGETCGLINIGDGFVTVRTAGGLFVLATRHLDGMLIQEVPK